MKPRCTKGTIAIEIKGQLARELDRLLDKDIHNIAKEDRWMVDLDPLDKAVMSMLEMQCAVFELKAAKAQNKIVSERTAGANEILHSTLRDDWDLCSFENDGA